ncbi:TetR/AcrR family transcriptional regulator [Microbacterium radiodurans]|nr:TetR/AcrR family transcriptional regulator [Microbacterium radiodurans]
MRSDTRRNIRLLLNAVAEEIEENPTGLSMQSAAARAGIGTATAYRYFSTLDDLVAAYVLEVFEELKTFSHDATESGAELFNVVLREWVDVVLRNGQAMVHLRSRSGFLQRLDAGNPVIDRSREIWERPLASLLDDMDEPATDLRWAMFLANILSDPREILDLHRAAGLSVDEICASLDGAIRGAIAGWSTVTSSTDMLLPDV